HERLTCLSPRVATRPVGASGALGGVTVPPPVPIIGASSGCSLACFAAWTVRQSSSRIPPVSPEFGFHDQKVKLIPREAIKLASVSSHCLSLVVSYFVPNSPRRTGAVFAVIRYPQWLSQIPAKLFG